jgi:hypothetical protein
MGHERLSEAHRPDSVTTRLKRIGAFIVFAGAMFLLVQIFALIDAEVYLRSWGCHSATVTESGAANGTTSRDPNLPHG